MKTYRIVYGKDTAVAYYVGTEDAARAYTQRNMMSECRVEEHDMQLTKPGPTYADSVRLARSTGVSEPEPGQPMGDGHTGYPRSST